MRKMMLRLDVDALSVESYATGDAADPGRRGTVRGHSWVTRTTSAGPTDYCNTDTTTPSNEDTTTGPLYPNPNP